MKDRKVIICRGIPGSGKSTWAKSEISKRGSKDWIRLNLDDLRKMAGDYWVPARESFIGKLFNESVILAVKDGKNLILDNMNLNEKAVNNTLKLIKDNQGDFDYEVEYRDFFISLNEAIKRDSLRANPIGASEIKRIYRTYQHIFLEEQNNKPILSQINRNLPRAILVDLDGTIAINNHKRPFYGKAADVGYINDGCDLQMTSFITDYCKNNNIKLILFTGREDTPEGRNNTLQWAKNWGLNPHELIMRKSGDFRGGDEVKLDLFNEFIRDKYYIDAVFEDSTKVVNMFRKLGLLTLQPWANDY